MIYRRRYSSCPLFFTQSSLTKQSFKDSCDVNNIVKRWTDTGIVAHTSISKASFGDFSSSDDYFSALNKVSAVDDLFFDLPAVVRSHFSNDPSKLLDFVKGDNDFPALYEDLVSGNSNKNSNNNNNNNKNSDDSLPISKSSDKSSDATT